MAAGRHAQKRRVKIRVVRDQDGVCAAEREKCRQRRRLVRGILYHLVGDAGQLRDLFGDRPLGVDKRVEAVGDLAVSDAHGADLRDAVLIGGKARRLEVKRDKFAVERLPAFAGHGGDEVIDKIRLGAVQDLNRLAGFFEARGRVHRFRERLRDAVVGNRDGRMAPFGGAGNQIRRRVDGVHLRHIRM